MFGWDIIWMERCQATLGATGLDFNLEIFQSDLI